MKKAIRAGLIGLGVVVCAASAFAQAPERAIEKVTGDLYRAQNNQHYTVFLVTQEGIIVSDPINREFATWLREQIEQRFDVPVRYVLYSHHHWDHASGGEVFADTAEFVGHETMPEALALRPADTPLNDAAAAMDANRNGRVERAEASGNLQGQFDLYDENTDGALTGAEVARGPVSDVHPAETLFADRRAVSLGGKTVEMIHVGPTHSPDMTVLRFPAERAVFLVDFISLKRLPFQNLPGMDVDQLTATIRGVEALDFDIGVGGHGAIGTKQDVAMHREYLEELRDAVAAGIAAGQSLEQLQASIKMEEYRDWVNYEQWLPLNIAGMHRILTAE
jgi:glyoxylase-like metal-dependent hydrolase (beta-lactamase superfamily II)